jgi:hypothetical protein
MKGKSQGIKYLLSLSNYFRSLIILSREESDMDVDKRCADNDLFKNKRMNSNDHKYSVPVNLLVNDHNYGNAFSGSVVATKWYRHLVSPRTPTGLWIRQVVERSEDYLIHIMNQTKMMNGECNCCMILCGGGYDILLLQNDTSYPEYVDNISMISLTLCLTSTLLPNHLDENYLNEYGIIDPIDDLYLHMRATVNMGVFPGNFRIYLKASFNCPAYQDQNISKKVILRIKNHSHNAVIIENIDRKDSPNNIFSYQYDVWGTSLSTPQAETKSVGATKKQNSLPSKQSAQQPSRKRVRTGTSGTTGKQTEEGETTDKKTRKLQDPKIGRRDLKEPIVQNVAVVVTDVPVTNETKDADEEELERKNKNSDRNKDEIMIPQTAGKKNVTVMTKPTAQTAKKISNSRTSTIVANHADQTKPNDGEKRKVRKITTSSRTVSTKVSEDVAVTNETKDADEEGELERKNTNSDGNKDVIKIPQTAGKKSAAVMTKPTAQSAKKGSNSRTSTIVADHADQTKPNDGEKSKVRKITTSSRTVSTKVSEDVAVTNETKYADEEGKLEITNTNSDGNKDVIKIPQTGGKKNVTVMTKPTAQSAKKGSNSRTSTIVANHADQTKPNDGEKSKVRKVTTSSRTVSTKVSEDVAVTNETKDADEEGKPESRNKRNMVTTKTSQIAEKKSSDVMMNQTVQSAMEIFSNSSTSTIVANDADLTKAKNATKNKVSKMAKPSHTVSSKVTEDSTLSTGRGTSSNSESDLAFSKNPFRNEDANTADKTKKVDAITRKKKEDTKLSKNVQNPVLTSSSTSDTLNGKAHDSTKNSLKNEVPQIKGKETAKDTKKTPKVSTLKKPVDTKKPIGNQKDAKGAQAVNSSKNMTVENGENATSEVAALAPSDESEKPIENQKDEAPALDVDVEKDGDGNAVSSKVTKVPPVSTVSTAASSKKSSNKKDSSTAKGDNSEHEITPKISNADGDVVKKKLCFYYPFCQMTADICGGTQRGRCREVKSGRVNVAPDIDRKELSKMKREALKKLA